jgi:alkylated DNA repair dioxygenase AlkB
MEEVILNTRSLVQPSKDLPTDGPMGFESCPLDDYHRISRGELPAHLVFSTLEFQKLWEMHPAEFHVIRIHGRLARTPRWQQAFGRDYHYTGQVNSALPVPPILHSLLSWASKAIDGRLNGILVNWYDGQTGHYIGAHRDSTVLMIEGAPIVTISFGEERAFRVRPWKGSGFIDFPVRNGTVIVMPYVTNKHWTHEVPFHRTHTGRRISVTLRGFVGQDVGAVPVDNFSGK